MVKMFFSVLKQYNIKYARLTALYIALAAAAATANILYAQATGNMAQAADLGVSGVMTGFLIALAVAGMSQTVINSVLALLKQRAFGKAIHSIRGAFARRLLDMPYKDFALKNSGEGAALFTGDAPLGAEFVTTRALSQISQFATLLVSAVFMAFINWRLTLMYFALFPLLAVFQAKLSVPIVRLSKEASKRRAEYVSVVADALQNPLVIKSYGLEFTVERRFEDSFMKFYKAAYKSSKVSVRLNLMGIFATFLPAFALGMAACAAVINGDMTVSEFITLTIISGPVGNWLMMFSQELARLREASASAARVMEFAPDTADEDMKPDTSAGCAVVFDKVSFGYTEDTKIFEDVSFAVEKGSITAIAGASGCGKSTALKLLLGLYTPGGGKIALSSSHITYVPQDCYLLPVSIRENITGNLPCDGEKLRAACQNAGIYDYITGLPDGFDSVLTEAAANISGGQKQRLAMARAFYRDADILLFDEATSSLDPETERSVLEMFLDYVKLGGKTAVVIAHRQSVLDMSDRVITLPKGDDIV